MAVEWPRPETVLLSSALVTARGTIASLSSFLAPVNDGASVALLPPSALAEGDLVVVYAEILGPVTSLYGRRALDADALGRLEPASVLTLSVGDPIAELEVEIVDGRPVVTHYDRQDDSSYLRVAQGRTARVDRMERMEAIDNGRTDQVRVSDLSAVAGWRQEWDLVDGLPADWHLRVTDRRDDGEERGAMITMER